MPTYQFLIAGLTLVWIDLLLAGDNALVIAMAVRHLPPRERRIASICGASLAVALRVGLTFVAAALLGMPFLKLGGGLFILWIAYQVLLDAGVNKDDVPSPEGWMRAMWYVVIADLTMSVDNILAIAGASGGRFELILFGLAVSIPFVVLSSNLLVNLMERHPVVIYFGAGILAKVGGDMMLTDPWVQGFLRASNGERYLVDAVLAAVVLIAGRIAAKRLRKMPA